MNSLSKLHLCIQYIKYPKLIHNNSETTYSQPISVCEVSEGYSMKKISMQWWLIHNGPTIKNTDFLEMSNKQKSISIANKMSWKKIKMTGTQ